LFRDEWPDYGIDGSVELFDATGLATGHRFLVQLKGRATLKRLSIRIRRDTADYYKALDLPVLMVLVGVETQRIYARWFHDFDPYYGGLGEKWVTIGFDSGDEWTSSRAQLLESDLRAWRRARRDAYPLPIKARIQIDGDQVGGLGVARIDAAIRRAIAPLRHIIRIADDQELLRASITDERLVVSIVGRGAITLHTRGKPLDPDVYAADFLVLVGLMLGKAGEHAVGAQLVCRAGPRSTVVLGPELGSMAAGLLARDFRVVEALELAEQLAERDSDSFTSELLSLAALLPDPARIRPYEGFVEAYLKRRIASAREAPDGTGVAAAHSNFARFAHRQQRHREALRHFREACAHDPGYAERDFFWRELGATLFDAGRYGAARACYTRAVELNGTNSWCHYLADCLLFSGEFGAASREFAKAFTADPSIGPEWRLKAWVTDHLQRFLGVESHRRDRAAARALLRIEERSQDGMRRVLALDALEPAAWFNHGVAAAAGDPSGAFESFLAAAVIQRGDAEAWVNALMTSVWSDAHSVLAPYVVHAMAGAVPRSSLLAAIDECVAQQPAEFPVDEFVNTLREALDNAAEAQRADRSFELRLLGPDGAYETLRASGHSVGPEPSPSDGRLESG
jgi:tetratricopeptide (TPR) repeat protein